MPMPAGWGTFRLETQKHEQSATRWAGAPTEEERRPLQRQRPDGACRTFSLHFAGHLRAKVRTVAMSLKHPEAIGEQPQPAIGAGTEEPSTVNPKIRHNFPTH